MSKIKEVRAREILDSRGWPTVEVDVLLEDGAMGRAAVPSGASTGEHEAVELRDGDKARYAGKGVLKAVQNAVKALGGPLVGRDASEQAALDERMIALDGTPAKSKLGANAILGISMAASRAAAAKSQSPLYIHLRRAFRLATTDFLLPAPMLNIINGGKHADSGLNVQEFMIVPTGASTFSEALRMGAETYHVLKKLLAKKGHSVAVGDEGGFAPRLKSHDAALDFIMDAIRQAGFEGKISVALDAAASEFHSSGQYDFEGKKLPTDKMIKRYSDWVAAYPIVSIEDPLAEDDWEGWKAMTAALGSKIRIVGDDHYVTNVDRLERGIREASANAILIKLNQIGTVTETVRAVLRAQQADFSAIISHRSGETEDPYIADLAVALNAGAIKTGAPCRSERLAKYNQLIRIEGELGVKAGYACGRAFKLASPAPKRAAAARS